MFFVASSFPICPKRHPNISECVKQAIEVLRPRIKSGNFGEGLIVQGIDPLRLNDIYILRPSFNANLTNVIASGSGNFNIEKIRVDFDRSLMDVLVTVPKIQVSGYYVNQFGLGILKTRGKGRISAWLGNMKLRIGAKGRHDIKNGQEFIKFDKIVVTPKITQIKIHMENLLPDKALNEGINAFLNQNVNLFVPEVEEAIQTTLCKFAEP